MLATVLCWPVVAIALTLVWPGPQLPPVFTVDNSVGAQPTVEPPVDSGTQLALNENGTARIFWEIPEDGVVQLTIEIDEAGNAVGVESDTVDLPEAVTGVAD